MAINTKNNALPILAIFLQALALPKKHFSSIFRFGLPFILLGVLLSSGLEAYLDRETLSPSIVYAIDMLSAVLYWVTIVLAIVGCHRAFLLENEKVISTKTFRWTRRELRYLGWWLGIAIISVIILMPFMFIFISAFSESISKSIYEDYVMYTVMSVVSIPLYYIISRLSLVLPATAIDEVDQSLSWSWRLSAGNGWRLTLLIGFLPFVTDMVFNWLPEIDSILYFLVVDAAWMVVGVIEIGLLSLSYSFLSMRKEIQGK